MADIDARSTDRPSDGHLSGSDVDALASDFSGEALVPGGDEYEEARRIWNGMIDRKPGAIARCHSTEDVVGAVRFAADRDALVAVRGGGHNIAGNAVCDGGLMIDLSPMNGVSVDADNGTARVGPGATLGDMDRATQEHGLATPLGINSTTGVAGLTLGGGFGWLSRKHGMTVDNLLSAEVVTADGRRLTASPRENEDLFWGLQGGGGNFGVVTSFAFQLHPLGPEVTAGVVVHALEDVPDVLPGYREIAERAPDELACWLVLRKAPPLPFLDEEDHGRGVLVLAVFYAGEPEEGAEAVRPYLELGSPLGQHVEPQPYVEFQTAFDPLLEPGARNYWKSHNLPSLSDEALDTLLEYTGRLPSDESEIFVAQLGGQMGRVPSAATAFPHRDADYVVNVHTRWRDPAEDQRCIAWARELFDATTPFSTGGVYVNFLNVEGEERVRAAYGSNYDRLVEIKNRYDPGNLFRMNQNVRPTVAA